MNNSYLSTPCVLLLSFGCLLGVDAVASAADTIPPTVSITQPLNHAVVAGTITAVAAASDNVGIRAVQLLVDGTRSWAGGQIPEVTAAPYAVTLNTSLLADGPHTLSAYAYDVAGNFTLSSAVSITVGNRVLVSMTAPANTATVSGTVAMAATASSAAAIVGVQFMVDGANRGSEDLVAPYTSSLDTTQLGNGAHTIAATARNAAGVQATAPPIVMTVANVYSDITPPVVSSVSSSAITINSATMTWTTDEQSTSQVEYGQTTAYGSLSGVNTSLVLAHSISVSGLVPMTQYHYRVRSADAAANVAASADYTFTTLADTTPPTVPTDLFGPANSPGQIQMTWLASTDNVGVAGYKVFRDGVRITTTTAQIYFDTGLTPSTTYIYTVSAYDAAGNNSAQSLPVSVRTQAGTDALAPTIVITSPLNNASVSGTIVTVATATDNVGVAAVQFRVDSNRFIAGVPIPEDSTAPYAYTLDTTSLTDGTHVISASARDAAGNIATSGAVTIRVTNSAAADTTAPSVPGGLAATVVSNTQINLTWTASTDNVAVMGYALIETTGQTPLAWAKSPATAYSFKGLQPNTTYSWKLYAVDTSVNASSPFQIDATTHAPVTITSMTSNAIANNGFMPGWATFGQAVPQGLAFSGLQVGNLPTQTDIKNRWPDGSIKYALVTADIPSAGNYSIKAGALALGLFNPVVPAASVTLNIDGTDYTATLPGAPGPDTWMAGPLVQEWRATVVPGNHPFLTVIFDTRVYSDGKPRLDVTVENTRDQGDATGVTYDITVVANGRTLYTKSSVTQYSLTRGRLVFPIDGLVLSQVTPDLDSARHAAMLPRSVSAGVADSSDPGIPGIATAPSVAYVPYVATGDRYYLDEVMYGANHVLNRGYAAGAQTLLNGGTGDTVWGLQNLVDAAVAAPDDAPAKAYLSQKVINSLNRLRAYVDARAAMGADPDSGNGLTNMQTMSLWQDSYAASILYYARELGLTGSPDK